MKRLFVCCFFLSILMLKPIAYAQDATLSSERIKTIEAKVDALSAKIDLLLQLQQQSSVTPPAPPPSPTSAAPTVTLSSPPPPVPSAEEDIPSFVKKEEYIPVVETPPVANTPEAQYKAAFQLINEGKYDEATEKLQHFITTYNSHKLAALAQYWLGEIYFEKKQLQKAHDAFMASYQSDPNSEKGPESLLKVSLVLKELEQPKQACVALEILNRDYPDSQATARAKVNTDLVQLKCKAVPVIPAAEGDKKP